MLITKQEFLKRRGKNLEIGDPVWVYFHPSLMLVGFITEKYKDVTLDNMYYVSLCKLNSTHCFYSQELAKASKNEVALYLLEN